MRGADTLHSVLLLLVAAVLGAILSFLAFPPFGPGLLIVPGIAVLLSALRLCRERSHGVLVGAVYGLVFFGGLMWWLAELELIALVLIPVQAVFLAVYGWWLVRFNERSPWVWLTMAVGSWAVMELARYHLPVGGLEWGAAGYALADFDLTRMPAWAIGTSGLTLVVVLVGALFAVGFTTGSWRWLLSPIPVVVLAGSLALLAPGVEGGAYPVAVVQGSTPCPFEHCPPNERLRTFAQHLELTTSLPDGYGGLVVWPEGSTGSTNADPMLNDEVREAIADQARRLRSTMVIGGDRVLSDTEWINANVYFDSNGEIVGEYRKYHGVPFGEYVPLRLLFDWIPALARVPRDMIRGEGPFVYEGIGSVISFEGGFSRYTYEVRKAGADVIIVNTNEASYGPDAPTSDQFINMTRMRAVELGVPVVHAAVTGKSVVIDAFGDLGPTTGLGTMEILDDTYGSSRSTVYMAIGNLVMWLAAVAAVVVWSRSLVGSRPMQLACGSMRSNTGRRDQED